MLACVLGCPLPGALSWDPHPPQDGVPMNFSFIWGKDKTFIVILKIKCPFGLRHSDPDKAGERLMGHDCPCGVWGLSPWGTGPKGEERWQSLC